MDEQLLHGILHDIFLHGILDTLKVLPFLFLTYLLMEFLEHKASDKTRLFMERSGRFAPIVGGALGGVPQCGFSSVCANLFCGRVVSLGTLIAVFLSTSDEMLPIMISSGVHAGIILFSLFYKILIGIIAGIAIDLILSLREHNHADMHIHEICEDEGCHCEGGIWRSALHHTLSITLFLLIVTFFINALIFFIGEDNLKLVMNDKPLLSHLVASLFGLIPNCAASVALTEFYTEGIISLGTMLSGLFSGAGVGLLVLFKMNRRRMRENFIIVALLFVLGTIFGLLADIIPVEAILLG